MDIMFEGEDSMAVFNSMLGLICEVRSNPYHVAKFEASRRRWARAGM